MLGGVGREFIDPDPFDLALEHRTMSENKLIRVAFVKFSPKGKVYPTRCDREDIREGDEVEVLMRANSVDAYYIEGMVDSITHQRWNCTCRVVNLTSEVEYSFTDDGIFNREVKLPTAPVYSISVWREKKKQYYESLPASAQSEMREIYEAVVGNHGEDAYVGDGIWIKADGSLDERGSQ